MTHGRIRVSLEAPLGHVYLHLRSIDLNHRFKFAQHEIFVGTQKTAEPCRGR